MTHALLAVALAFGTDPGVTVGEVAPAFKLVDQAGKTRELAEFLKKGPVALVFYRSASW